MREVLQTITVVDAKDIPMDAQDWLLEMDVSTHCQNDIVQVEDDGNPFAEWLKKNGYEFKYHTHKYDRWDNIGIFAT